MASVIVVKNIVLSEVMGSVIGNRFTRFANEKCYLSIMTSLNPV